MPSTFTANLNLEEPARGEQIGTWDTPVNSNTTILDAAYGATATIPLTNANVTLNTAQYQSQYIVFTGTISANILITFPYIGSQHTIENRTNGAFTITLQTTNASAEVVCCPPFEAFDILTRASTAGVRYRNFGRVGEFMDYIGSSVPIWITNCTVPPYLNCDGTAFSSATYPALATILSTTVTPDAKGRVRATLNQGTTRLSSALGGINGNTNLAGGGLDSMTLTLANMVAHNHPSRTTSAGGTPNVVKSGAVGTGVQGSGAVSVYPTDQFDTLEISNSVGTNSVPTVNVQPTYVAGLTLVRAM